MRVTVLMRYPRVESSEWKRILIDRLIGSEFTVCLFFGESSLWRHLKAALKLYGWDVLFKRVKEKDENNGVNLYSHYKKHLNVRKVRELNSKKAVRLIQKTEPDLLLLLGSGIIRKPVLEIPKHKAIHCHQGSLPALRGVNTIEWSVFLDREVYLTTHCVDPGIDTGDILLKKKIEFDKDDSIKTLRQKCQSESVQLLVDTMNGLKNNSIIPQKQNKKDGKQYFAMHPFFLEIVAEKIKRIGK